MKVLVDIPDELSDKIYARKKLSTSETYELIGCVMNGAVITDNNIPFVTGLSADSADVPECETWSNNEEPIEIKYGEKNLIKGYCKHCSDHVDYMTWGEDTLYACRLRKCKFEGSE